VRLQSIGSMRARQGKRSPAHDEWAAQRDDADLKTSCAFCSWTYEGKAGPGRRAALAHRKAKHPEAPLSIRFRGKKNVVRVRK
jgi:hypothetical protein